MSAMRFLPIEPDVACVWCFDCSLNGGRSFALMRCSSAIRPALCRVCSYSLPGFPNPTMTHAIRLCYQHFAQSGTMQQSIKNNSSAHHFVIDETFFAMQHRNDLTSTLPRQ